MFSKQRFPPTVVRRANLIWKPPNIPTHFFLNGSSIEASHISQQQRLTGRKTAEEKIINDAKNNRK